eukprot:COSAG02_NODE_273_length_26316_cov_13.661060_2_plen_75_part_00
MVLFQCGTGTPAHKKVSFNESVLIYTSASQPVALSGRWPNRADSMSLYAQPVSMSQPNQPSVSSAGTISHELQA